MIMVGVLLSVDTVATADACPLSRTCETCENLSSCGTVVEFVYPVCETCLIRCSSEEYSVECGYELLVVEVEVKELLACEETVSCFGTGNLLGREKLYPVSSAGFVCISMKCVGIESVNEAIDRISGSACYLCCGSIG